MAEGRAIQAGLGAIGQTAGNWRAYAQERERSDASTQASLEAQQWMQGATQNQIIDANRARELGYEGPLLYNEDLSDRDNIAIQEILPDIAKAKMDAITDKYAESISGSGNRAEWVNRRRVAAQKMYGGLVEEQSKYFFNERRAREENSIEAARRVGDYELAAEIAKNYTGTPSEREALVQGVKEFTETDNFRDAILAEDMAQMMEYEQYLRSDDYSGPLTKEQRVTWANILDNAQDQLVAEGVVKRNQVYDTMRVQYEVAKETDNYAEAWRTLAEMNAVMRANGDIDYVSKEFFANEWGSLAKDQVEREMNADIGDAFLSGNYGAINPTDSEQKKVMDGIIEKALAQASRTDEEQGTGTFNQDITHQSLINRAARVGYMPTFYREAIRDMNQPNISVPDASRAAAYYNSFATQAPHLVSELSQNVRGVAQEVHAAALAGRLDEDVLREIHERMRDSSEQTLRDRESRYMSLKQDYDKPLDAEFDSRVKNWVDYLPFLTGDSETAQWFTDNPNDRLRTNYNQLVRHHMMNGSTEDSAYELAWQDFTRSHQVSAINGKPQLMRLSPETIYGMTPEEARDDKNHYLSSVIVDMPGSPDDYLVYPDNFSMGQSQPSYAVYYRDPETDAISMVRTDKGYLRYVPDPGNTKARRRQQDIANAKIAHEVEQIRQADSPDLSSAIDGYEKIKELTGKNAEWEKRKQQYVERQQEMRDARSGSWERKRHSLTTGQEFLIDQRSREIAADRQVLRSLQDEG